MGSWYTTVDFRVDDELGRSSNLAETCFRGTRLIWRVGTGRVQLPIAATMECIQEGSDILFIIEVYDFGVAGAIADLS